MCNQHGLSRTIPNEIKYAIRKHSGFGCVHCGIAIGQYEHIEPEFKDAKTHDPACMTFLCGTIHDKVTRGYVAKETVWAWKNNPKCNQDGHCHESFQLSTKDFILWAGGAKINRIEKVITYDDECILKIQGPEETGAPYRLSAIFHDESGKRALQVVENEWVAESSAFDIICEGGKIGIRTQNGFALKILCFPPDILVLEYLDMVYKGLRIRANRNQLYVAGPQGGSANVQGRLLTAIEDGCSLFTFSSQKPGVTIGGGIQIAPLDEKMPSKPLRSYYCGKNKPCPCGSGKKYKKCCDPIYDYSF